MALEYKYFKRPLQLSGGVKDPNLQTESNQRPYFAYTSSEKTLSGDTGDTGAYELSLLVYAISIKISCTWSILPIVPRCFL